MTIRSLDNAIASSVNAKKQAEVEYSKLTIYAPISGVVDTVDADIGTEISTSTPILTLASNNNTEIQVTLNQNEITNVSIGDAVEVEYGDKTYNSQVYSKSSIADENLGYSVGIVLKGKIDLLGGSTVVRFLGDKPGLSVPLQIVEIGEDNKGTVNTFVDGGVEVISVELGKIDGNNVELLSELPEGVDIITTDMSNFNQKTQSLTLKK